jgi:hypothetical protein
MPNNSAQVQWDAPAWKNTNDASVVQVGKVGFAQNVVARLGRAASYERSSADLSARWHRGS